MNSIDGPLGVKSEQYAWAIRCKVLSTGMYVIRCKVLFSVKQFISVIFFLDVQCQVSATTGLGI